MSKMLSPLQSSTREVDEDSGFGAEGTHDISKQAILLKPIVNTSMLDTYVRPSLDTSPLFRDNTIPQLTEINPGSLSPRKILTSDFRAQKSVLSNSITLTNKSSSNISNTNKVIGLRYKQVKRSRNVMLGKPDSKNTNVPSMQPPLLDRQQTNDEALKPPAKKQATLKRRPTMMVKRLLTKQQNILDKRKLVSVVFNSSDLY